MNFLTSLSTHPKMGDRRTISIIPVLKKDNKINCITIKNYPAWLWSVQYAKIEHSLPIVCTDDPEISANCEQQQIGHLNVPSDITIGNLVSLLLKDAPCELFFILDTNYPLRPRGVLKSIAARAIADPPVASFSTIGLSAHDTRTYLFTKEFVHSKTEYKLQLPTICSTPADKVESILSDEQNKLYNPWFEPKLIAVVLEHTNIPENTLKNINACDLKVYVSSPFANKNRSKIQYDITTQTFPENNVIENTLIYSFRPDNKLQNICDVSGWSNKYFKCSTLSELVQSLLFIQRLYPFAHILYFGSPISSQDVALLPEKERNFYMSIDYSIFETSVWTAIMEYQMFIPAEKIDAVVSADTPKSTALPGPEEDVDPNTYDLYQVHHPGWDDIIFVDPLIKRGKRLRANGEFTLINVVPFKCMKIKWDEWGQEHFCYNSEDNIWEKCDKEKYDNIMNNSFTK